MINRLRDDLRIVILDIEACVRDAEIARERYGERSPQYERLILTLEALDKDKQAIEFELRRYESVQPVGYDRGYSRSYDRAPAAYNSPYQPRVEYTSTRYERLDASDAVSSGSRFASNNTQQQPTTFNRRVELPVGNSSRTTTTQPKSTPYEGSELVLTVAPNLECRKITQGPMHKYEVFGNYIEDGFTASNLQMVLEDGDSIERMTDAKKYCIQHGLMYVGGKVSRELHGVELVGKILGDINSNGLQEAIKQSSASVGNYLDKYYTGIINTCVDAGAKLFKTMDSIASDLRDMAAIWDNSNIKVKTYCNKMLEVITSNASSQVSIENITNKDKEVTGGYTLTHNIPFIYIDDMEILGNLIELMKTENACCVKEESNPKLFKVLNAYMPSNTVDYNILYHIGNGNVLYRYVIMADIYGNFVISR